MVKSCTRTLALRFYTVLVKKNVSSISNSARNVHLNIVQNNAIAIFSQRTSLDRFLAQSKRSNWISKTFAISKQTSHTYFYLFYYWCNHCRLLKRKNIKIVCKWYFLWEKLPQTELNLDKWKFEGFFAVLCVTSKFLKVSLIAYVVQECG